ncbi:hypothetical protein AGLY_001286, partial [Aphis glycines]
GLSILSVGIILLLCSSGERPLVCAPDSVIPERFVVRAAAVATLRAAADNDGGGGITLLTAIHKPPPCRTLVNAISLVRLKSSVPHLLAGGVFAVYDLIILLILNFQLGQATLAAISRNKQSFYLLINYFIPYYTYFTPIHSINPQILTLSLIMRFCCTPIDHIMYCEATRHIIYYINRTLKI